MKKFLINDSQDVQIVPNEIMDGLFPKWAEVEEQVKINSNRWYVIKHGLTPTSLEYQVAIQNIVSIQNIYYHVFIFQADGELEVHIPVKATRLLPPVSEKREGLDYFDWLEIQLTIINYLKSKDLAPIELDQEADGKFVYLVKNKASEVEEMMARNESYPIGVVPAKVFIEKAEEFKKAQEAQKSKIIV